MGVKQSKEDAEALIKAAREGDLITVKGLIAKGVDLNVVDEVRAMQISTPGSHVLHFLCCVRCRTVGPPSTLQVGEHTWTL